MKNGRVLVIFATLLVCALAAVLLLPAASARPPACDCDTPIQETAMVWGHGADCSAAFDDGVAQARALTNCADGVCWEGVVVDNACTCDAVECMIDLHLQYRCYDCGTFEEPGPEPAF